MKTTPYGLTWNHRPGDCTRRRLVSVLSNYLYKQADILANKAGQYVLKFDVAVWGLVGVGGGP